MPEPKPVILIGCQIGFDLDKKDLPTVVCRRDRERLANPKLQEGMVCENRFEVFEQDRKLIHRYEIICRPAEKVYRRLNVDEGKQLEHLKERLRELRQKQGVQPARAHEGKL